MKTGRIKKVIAVSVVSAGAAFGIGIGTASATTIDASSFAYELCGDAAFSNLEDDGIHVTKTFDPGTGPFGGGKYDCATGELTF